MLRHVFSSRFVQSFSNLNNIKHYIIVISWALSIHIANAQLKIETNKRLETLIKEVFLGSADIKVSNIKYQGATGAIAYFDSQNTKLGINDGIILTTGNVFLAKGPNNNTVTGISNDMKGDADLDRIARGETMDAAFLQFDFVPETDSISFQYIFASEEYMEFVNMSYNDVFGFFLSGPGIVGKVNLAVVPGTTEIVSVDNINAYKNSHLYIDNGSTKSSKEAINPQKIYDEHIQFDGFTRPLTAGHKVIPNNTYTIKIAIADVGDRVVDSAVFLKAGSFKSSGEKPKEIIISRIPTTASVKKDGKVFRKPLPRSTLIEFDFDSAVIPDTSMDNLYFVCNAIKPYSQARLEVRGHTDYMGSEHFNIGLSNRRVNSVVEFLVKEGFPRHRIVYKEGLGESEPKATNETEEGRQRNRRVEVLILWD